MANIKRANTSGITKSGSAIADVPDAPVIGAATNVGTSRAYNNGSATVAFTAAATGGTPTSYTATSTPGSFTASGAGSPLTVTGLQSATSYTFAVTATNTTATGAASAASSSITATTIPQNPTIGTPTVATGQSYSGSAAVSVPFTAGATGGAAVSAYTVTSSSGNTGTGSSSPISVTDTVSTARTYTVTATNANGTSTASSASASTTPVSVPQAPTVGTASITNTTTVSLAFTAGATGGSAITSYTVASSPSISLSTSGSSTPLTVTGTFVQGTAYTFTITATNAQGTSSASSASNSITPYPLIYSFYYGNTGFTSAYGLYKTSDGATTWSTASSGLSAGQSTSPSRGIDGQRNLASNGTGTIVAGGNYLAANNDQNVAYYSTNSGTSWTAVVMGSPASGNSISYSTGRATYGNGLYAVCQSGSSVNYRAGVWRSSNLSSWSMVNLNSGSLSYVASLAYSPFQTKWFAAAGDGKYYSSTDLATWTTITGNTMENATASAANGNAAGWVVAGQSNVRWYYSGSAWTSNAEPYSNVVTDVTWGDGRYVSIAALTDTNTDYTLAYSTNGTTWTQMASPVGGYSPSPQRIHYQNGLWYLSMSNYDVYTSTSGTGSWTKKTASNFLLQSMTSST